MDQTPPVPLGAIYGLFFRIGLFSFGGQLTSWIHREVVLVRGWMTNEEFLSGMALSQILPGVNSTNTAVFVGQRLRGAWGATVAITAMLTGPFFAVILAGILYKWIIGWHGVQSRFHAPACLAGAALLVAHDLLRAAKRLLAKRKIDQALVAGHMTSHQRVVGLLHLSGLEGHAESAVGVCVGGQHHHAAGVAIEAVHDARPGKSLCRARHQTVRLLGSDAGHAEQSARLVHHHEAVALREHAVAVGR
jgi:chromate transporter